MISSRTAEEMLEGALLSDAHIGRILGRGKSVFSIALSGSLHRDWLVNLGLALYSIGEVPTPGHPKTITREDSTHKPYEYCYLTSRSSYQLAEWRSRWYPNGTKAVPAELVMTPVTLANWFMGDGSSGINAGTTIRAFLHTEAFSSEDLTLLEAGLASLGIDNVSRGKHEDKVILSILAGSIDKFMEVVSPYVVQSYKYKIIRRDTKEIENG